MAKLPNPRYATAREFAETIQKAFRTNTSNASILPKSARASIAPKKPSASAIPNLLPRSSPNSKPKAISIPTLRFFVRRSTNTTSKSASANCSKPHKLGWNKMKSRSLSKSSHEILKIDPQNSEALKLRKRIEQQRSQQQVSEWLDLARKHLDRHDFSEARRALKEVFNLKYDDPEAARLKAQVDTPRKRS